MPRGFNSAHDPRRQVGSESPVAMTMHDVINDLTRKARGLAPAVAETALDTAGTTRESLLAEYGPRQREAHRLVTSAFDLNRTTGGDEISDEEHEEFMRRGGYGADANRFWASGGKPRY